jgi:hypothetical protein
MPTPSLRQTVLDLLEESRKLNPGPWVDHSLLVAKGAELIAEKHPGLDPEMAFHVGALHDIGRRFGVTAMRHVYDGYHFLFKLGLEDAARVCLTHSYAYQDFRAGVGHFDGSEEEKQFVIDYLARVEYDDYDRLIQLMDAVTMGSGYCLMEKRMVDVILRYCMDSEAPIMWTSRKWGALFQIRRMFEEAIGCSIYDLLPGVVEETFNYYRPGEQGPVS